MEEQMKRLIVRLWKEEEGQDLTEYALLLALISVVMVATIQGLAGAIQTAIGNATAALAT
jgi:Flp pilus assembly pilin Flp